MLNPGHCNGCPWPCHRSNGTQSPVGRLAKTSLVVWKCPLKIVPTEAAGKMNRRVLGRERAWSKLVHGVMIYPLPFYATAAAHLYYYDAYHDLVRHSIHAYLMNSTTRIICNYFFKLFNKLFYFHLFNKFAIIWQLFTKAIYRKFSNVYIYIYIYILYIYIYTYILNKMNKHDSYPFNVKTIRINSDNSDRLFKLRMTFIQISQFKSKQTMNPSYSSISIKSSNSGLLLDANSSVFPSYR